MPAKKQSSKKSKHTKIAPQPETGHSNDDDHRDESLSQIVQTNSAHPTNEGSENDPQNKKQGCKGNPSIITTWGDALYNAWCSLHPERLMIVYGFLRKAIDLAVRVRACFNTKKENKMVLEEYRKTLEELERTSGIARSSFRESEDYLVSTNRYLREKGDEMEEKINKLIKEKERLMEDKDKKYEEERQKHEEERQKHEEERQKHEEERQKLKRKNYELEEELHASKLNIMEIDADRKRAKHEPEEEKKRNKKG
ncbi:hypothetical protein MOSE0_F00980 [Monosporozyma servazzii]